MADNRMVLVCRRCKAEKVLAKFFKSSGWSIRDYDTDAWMTEHATLCATSFNGDAFDLRYEHVYEETAARH